MQHNNIRFRFRLTIKTLVCATAAAACFCAAWVVGANPKATSLQKSIVLIGWSVAVLLAIYYSTFAAGSGFDRSNAGSNQALSSEHSAKRDSAIRRILRRIRFGAIVGFLAMPASFLLGLPFITVSLSASEVQDRISEFQQPRILLSLVGGLVGMGLMGMAFGTTIAFLYAGIAEVLRRKGRGRCSG